MENKKEWISGAFGIAAVVIPLAMDGLGMQFPDFIYWGLLGIGGLCLLFALHGTWEMIYGWAKGSVRLQWPITITVEPKMVEKETPLSDICWQSEDEHIADLLKKIRGDDAIKSLFLDLIYGRQGKLPAIISPWMPGDDGQLYYIGKNAQPTEDEQKERVALAWLISNGLAKPTRGSIQSESQHWYLLENLGIPRKVKEKYEGMYSHEKRNC